MNNKRLEDLLDRESFVHWIKGECSTDEHKYWDTWLKEDPDHIRLKEEAEELMFALDNEYDTPDPLKELVELNKVIDDRSDSPKWFPPHNLNRHTQRTVGPIAAGIILLILMLGSVYMYQVFFKTPVQAANQTKPEPQKTIKNYATDYGEKLTFRLSDGSRIVLNANSSLKFSSKIEKGLNTEVWLEGEALFDITHLEGDQKRTFTVHTANGSIHVLGTRFAVNTFGKQTETVLEEGKISIQVKEREADSQKEYLLQPGERARFRAFDNKIVVSEVNTRIYTAWTQNKLIFDNTPMQVVANRIEDTFGVEVVVSKELANEKLSGSIKSDNLEVLKEALNKILDSNLKKKGNNLIIGGQ